MRTPDNALWVTCKPCRHTWPAVHLPMPMEKAAAVMLATHCPRCGAEPGELKVASEEEVTWVKDGK